MFIETCNMNISLRFISFSNLRQFTFDLNLNAKIKINGLVDFESTRCSVKTKHLEFWKTVTVTQ